VIDKLHRSLAQALADPAVKAGFAAQGLTPAPSRSPDEFAQFFRNDFKRIEKLVQLAGVKPE
jgi:tripartite-type tricarboxylate transporter receptor subunit TctC